LTVLKKLVTGRLSLVVTFWVWGLLGGFLIGLIGASGVKAGNTLIVPLTYFIKTVLICAVLSGITFMLRRKIIVFGVIALLYHFSPSDHGNHKGCRDFLRIIKMIGMGRYRVSIKTFFCSSLSIVV
jgi:hypothetical protein